MKEHLFNVRTNKKHNYLEKNIKKLDVSQDMSRTAIFERMLRIADSEVVDWVKIQLHISQLEPLIDDEIQISTNFQAKYTDQSKKVLDKISYNIRESLIGVKVLQNQYLLLLLMTFYLEYLKKQILSINNTNLPEILDKGTIVKFIVEMFLLDSNCTEEIASISKILLDWRSSHGYSSETF